MPFTSEIVGLLIFVIGLVLFRVAISLWHMAPQHLREARKISESPMNAIRGRVPTERDQLRDYRVSKGMVYKNGKFEPNGFLSDDYINTIIK